MMKYTSYVLTMAMVFNSFLTLQTASAGEVVKGGGTSAAKSAGAAKGPELTDEEKKMGGAMSPYPSCNNLIMVEASKYEKNKEYWKAREKSCSSSTANCGMKVQVVADSGMFASRSLTPGQSFSGTVTVGAFLNSVRERASIELNKNIQRYEQLQKNCLSGKAADASCGTSVANIRANLAKEIPQARLNLAFLTNPGDFEMRKFLTTKDYSLLIDDQLKGRAAGIKIPAGMGPLSAAEIVDLKKEYQSVFEAAQKKFEEEQKMTKARSGGREALSRIFRDLLNEKMAEKVVAFNAAVARVPELAYVGDSKAAEGMFATGISTMIADSKEALSRIKKAPTKKEIAAPKVDGSLLQYAGYSALIEKMLNEELATKGASSCAVATSAFNQLKTDDARTAAIGGVAVAGLSLGLALSPQLAGALGVGMSAGAASAMTTAAVAAGMVGGLSMTAMDAVHASDVAQDARAGLTTSADAKEAAKGASIGAVMSPLDFLGGGVVFGTAVGVAAKQAAKSSSMAMSRWGAAAVAKQEIKVAAVKAAEVEKAAAKAAEAQSKAVRNLEAAKAKGDEKAIAKAEAALAKVSNKEVEQAGDKAVKEFLGREYDEADRQSFERMAKAGFLGTPDAPVKDVAAKYAEATKNMSAAERKDYSEKLKALADAAEAKAADAAKAATAKADPGRVEAAGTLTMAAAEAVADPAQAKALGSIMKPDSGWPADSLSGVRAVFQQMKETAGKGVKKTKETAEAVGDRFKAAYAKLKGIDPKSKEALDGCICAGMCPVRARAAIDPLEILESTPRFVACVAH